MLLIQKEIAEHIDLSQPAVSGLMDRLGIDWKTSTIDEIRVAYIRHLREQAAGRAASGDLDLATERARLAKEQADKVAMQNAVTRGDLAPVVMIEEVLTKTAARIAGIFDAIPGLVRRRVPSLRAEEIELISAEIARIRNVVAGMSLSDLNDDQSNLVDSDNTVVDV